MFAYCNNNPVSTHDPTGTFPWHVVIAATIGGCLSALGTSLTGGTRKEAALSGIRGALFCGLMTAAPSTAPYIIGVDVAWTVYNYIPIDTDNSVVTLFLISTFIHNTLY